MSDVAARLARPKTIEWRLTTALRSALASDAVMMVALGAWVVVLLAATWGRWGDITMDTGYDLVAATKTAGGELPFVDYTYFYGPLSALLLGGVFAVTGPSLGAAVAVGIVIAVAIVALTYRLARLIVEPLPAALVAGFAAAAAISGENASYVLPHTTSAPLAILLMLVIVLALAGRDEPGRGRLLAAGAATGLVAITRPEVAVWVYPAVAVWLGVRLWRAADRRAAVREAAVLLAPALAIPLAVYGAFAAAIGLDALLWENLYSKDYFAAAGSVLTEGWAPYTPGSFAWLAGETIVYAAGVAGLLALVWAIERGGRMRTAALALGALGALGVLAVLAVRPETLRFYLTHAYAWIPVGVWTAAIVLVLRARRGPWTRERTLMLLTAVLVGVAALSTYRSFRPFPNPLHPDKTPYLAALVGLLLVWLHVRVIPSALPRRWAAAAAAVGTAWLAVLVLANGGLTIHDARSETSVFSGPGGSMHARPAEGPLLQDAMTLIARETQAGEPILVAPRLTAIYTMADRENPLPELSLLPGMLPTKADERRAIAQMDDVRLAVIDRTPLGLFELGTFGEGYNREIGAWLERDFERIAQLRGTGEQLTGIDVWKRTR